MAFKVTNTEAGILLTKYGKVDVNNPDQKILEKLYDDGSIYVEKVEADSKETKKIEAQKEEPKEEKKK